VRKTFASALLIIAFIAASAQSRTVVYFNPDESTILPAAARTLDSLALSLQKKGNYHLTINGFCDSTGTHTRNVPLGRARAISVYDYLYHHGVIGDSMVRIGYAESNPAAPGHDVASWAKNRRVEILVSSSFIDITKIFDPPIPVSEMQVGQRIILKDLNFVNNQTVLLPESVPVIKTLVDFMNAYPTIEIKINGYVCCSNDMELSVARARFVYDYLVRHGVDARRMSYAGYSNHFPLAPNDTVDEEAAKKNRRVEITITGK